MSMTELYQKDKHYSRTIFIFLVIYLLDKNGDHSPMLTSDIRRQNARMLSAAAGSPAEFGRRTEMSDSQVSQLIGENPTKNIGNKIARRIEGAFGKEKGWMDVLQGDEAVAGTSEGSPRTAERSTDRTGAGAPLTIVTEIPETYVDADDFVKLADLFSKSTRDGRQQILKAATRAEKIALSQRGRIAKD